MKKYALKFLGVFTALVFIACGSTPEPEPVVPEQKEEVVVETPKVEEPKNDFSENNKKLFAKTEEMRQKAIDADVKSLYSEGFEKAELIFESLKKDMDVNSVDDKSVEIKDLTNRYESLIAACEAQSLKKRVDGMDFSSLDKAAYEAAEKALAEYAAMGPDANGKDLLVSAVAARDVYKGLINKGFVALAGRERSAALEAKKNADSVKAGVAQKEVYTKASETFKKADSSYVTQNIEAAYEGYKSSKETFTKLYESISEKRAAVQAAIDKAKQKVADSANYATEADSIAPLTEVVAGIESEDAVLLEEDKLANPDDAIINVEEGKDAENAEKVAAAAIAAEKVLNAVTDDAVKAVEESIQEAQ